MLSFIRNLFSTESERNLKALRPYVEKANHHFDTFATLSHDELRAETQKLRAYLQRECQSIKSNIEQLKKEAAACAEIRAKMTLFDKADQAEKEHRLKQEALLLEILPQAFAIVKETARRFKEAETITVEATPQDTLLAKSCPHVTLEGTKASWSTSWEVAGQLLKWNMVHYDVQLIGGVVLHQGKVVEMATGEGKTLAATLPAFLNALTGQGVHIVTTNNYLAQRDAQWMGPIYQFHGLTVDCIENHPPHSPARRKAYQADITYGTNNEFGFDYLRDNMAEKQEEQVQRGHPYAILDEIDSLLIDDARTPLIISGPAQKDYSQDYRTLKPRVQQLYEAQKQLVAKFFTEAQQKLQEKRDDPQGGLSLFRVYRGLPKYKPLISYLSEKGIKKRLAETEDYYLKENAALMPQADEPLFFTIDQKLNSVDLTDKGIEYLSQKDEGPDFFVLPDLATNLAAVENNEALSDEEKIEQRNRIVADYNTKSVRLHTVSQLLKAYALFERDVDYIVLHRQVKIVDEKTGRILSGRRYSNGLHQALEAKENVSIQGASQTYASITTQNQFLMYQKLSGMTGTAATEAAELWDIYRLQVVVVPTNKPVIRKDLIDRIYKTQQEKYQAIVAQVHEIQKTQRPILLITPSVEVSEYMRKRLRLPPNQVLNAKNHRLEASIIAQAGMAGRVTIATQMAGRGTDIQLTPESKAAGGLFVIIVEKHETRRVDNQARGRAGRQGDPGTTLCYLSLEDQLIVHFRHEYMGSQVDKMFHKEGEVLEDPLITRAIETVQKNIEQNHFASRKRSLEYDNVLGRQRNVIYQRRNHALSGERLTLDVMYMTYQAIQFIVEQAKNHQSQKAFELALIETLGIPTEDAKKQDLRQPAKQLIKELYHRALQHQATVEQQLLRLIEEPLAQLPPNQTVFLPIICGEAVHEVPLHVDTCLKTKGRSLLQAIHSTIVLAVLDDHWKKNLQAMEELKESASNAAYEQKDPLLVYKHEAVNLFKQMMDSLNKTTIQSLHQAHLNTEKLLILHQEHHRAAAPKLREFKESTDSVPEEGRPAAAPEPVRSIKVAGRNERVTVRYLDGTVKKEVKFKTVEKDLAEDKCVLI